MLNDEKYAVLLYEDRLQQGRKKGKSYDDISSPSDKNRVILAVFRHAIERVLQWDPDTAFANMSLELIDALKLSSEWKNMVLPKEIRIYELPKYIVALLYPKFLPMFSLEALTLQVYRSTLEQRYGHFPKEYFSDILGIERAKICLRYMLNTYMIYPDIESMYREFANTEMIKKYLSQYGLSEPLKYLYATPLDYLHNTLATDQRNEFLYKYYTFMNATKEIEL